MTALIAALVLQAPFADAGALWQRVTRAHQGIRRLSYKVQVVDVGPKNRSKVIERGSLTYHRKGEISFTYRDNVVGVNATMGRDKSGQWSNGARDDVNSTNPANNALGYCDSIPDRWSYAPVNLLEAKKTGHSVDWKTDAPRSVTFRNVPCYLVEGVEGGDRTKVWIERKRMVLLRVEQDFGKLKRVTAFQGVSIQKR